MLCCLRRARVQHGSRGRGRSRGKLSCVAWRVNAVSIRRMTVLLWVGRCIVRLGSDSALGSVVCVAVLIVYGVVVVDVVVLVMVLIVVVSF